MAVPGQTKAHDQASSGVLSLDDLIDGQRAGGDKLALLAVAILVLFCDGFDLAAMGYVVPELTKEWGLGPASFVSAFSAGIIGMMLGGPLLGMAGDRHGRQRTIVAGLCAIGLSTLATLVTSEVWQLMALRFVTGVGLGGVIPNVAALVAELSPRHLRGRMVVIATLGMPIGIAMPGLVAGMIIPFFGWKGIMLLGGLLPLLVALCVGLVVPESLRYLLGQKDREADVRAIAMRLRPDLPLADTLRLVDAKPTATRGSTGQLFVGSLAVATPLLWICQAANQMANFFSLTWLPTLLQSAGATTAQAGAHSSLFAIGGLLAGLLLVFALDRLGVVPVFAGFAIGTPLVLMMADQELGPVLHGVVIFAAGLCVTGVNFGLLGLLAMFYPTPVRSLGTGWTQAAGRLGALAAPVVGGLLLQQNIPIGELTLAPALLMAVGTMASAVLAWLCYRKFGSLRVAEFTAQA